ncbi:hypothetical protein HHI36_017019 [Cryptolaemus montrouzieri]|uniref:Uncharacterized protein n=1 Tax=Cryptolaemus montrouzieri TaxID=559131 RepID=A0ABD2NLP8_9CUCU
MTGGKVHALSSMYESFQSSQSYYNDLTNLQATPIKFRRRNLSLPTFVERRLNYEPKILNVEEERDVVERKEEIQAVEAVYLDESSPDSSLRRSYSLSDLSMQKATTYKRKNEPNNLNTVGVDNISTSDEELETVVKPVVPPRNRQSLFENGHPTVVPRRHLNNKDRTKVSTDKCEEVISQLTVAANNVVELYNRLNDVEGDSPNEHSEKEGMVRKLELSIVRTNKVLHDCIFKKEFFSVC